MSQNWHCLPSLTASLCTGGRGPLVSKSRVYPQGLTGQVPRSETQAPSMTRVMTAPTSQGRKP